MSRTLAAPSLSSPILNTLNFFTAVLFRGVLLVPDFFHAPLDQAQAPVVRVFFWPTSGCWPFLKISWGRLSCVSSPGGASAIRTRSGSLSTALRHLRPSKALSIGRGASRRRPTSVAASGSSLPAALARRAPTAGVRPGGASTARPTRSAGSDPCG